MCRLGKRYIRLNLFFKKMGAGTDECIRDMRKLSRAHVQRMKKKYMCARKYAYTPSRDTTMHAFAHAYIRFNV